MLCGQIKSALHLVCVCGTFFLCKILPRILRGASSRRQWKVSERKIQRKKNYLITLGIFPSAFAGAYFSSVSAHFFPFISVPGPCPSMGRCVPLRWLPTNKEIAKERRLPSVLLRGDFISARLTGGFRGSVEFRWERQFVRWGENFFPLMSRFDWMFSCASES